LIVDLVFIPVDDDGGGALFCFLRPPNHPPSRSPSDPVEKRVVDRKLCCLLEVEVP
jgi:hypothetical protein